MTGLEQIARMEAAGSLDPDCEFCKRELYPNPNQIAPRHTASTRCQSGQRPHCTCDTCF